MEAKMDSTRSNQRWNWSLSSMVERLKQGRGLEVVIPAKAGIQFYAARGLGFRLKAGMTERRHLIASVHFAIQRSVICFCAFVCLLILLVFCSSRAVAAGVGPFVIPSRPHPDSAIAAPPAAPT